MNHLPDLDHGATGNGCVLRPISPTSAEAIEPTSGKMPGNCPQACTPVGLIYAAITISELPEARDEKVRAWV